MTKKLLLIALALGLIGSLVRQSYRGIQASAARQANMQALKDALADFQLPGCDLERDQSALGTMHTAALKSPSLFAVLGQTAEFQQHNQGLRDAITQAKSTSCATKSAASAAIDKQCKACHALLRAN
jgi:hypothetical protein